MYHSTPSKKDSNKGVCFFSNWRLVMNVVFVLHSKKAFSDVLEAFTSNNFRSLHSRVITGAFLFRH